MRITYLLHTADSAGGTERAILTQASGMAQRGHRVSVLSASRTADRPHFEVHRAVRFRYALDARDGTAAEDIAMPSRIVPHHWDGQYSAATDRTLPAALRKTATQVIVASTPALAMHAIRFARPDAVIVQQEHRVSQERGPSRIPLEIFGPQVDCLVSLTPDGTQWLHDFFGPLRPRLETITNALPKTFRPQASGRERLILGAGRLVAEKRFDHLVKAFALVAETRSDWRLRIYGGGGQRQRLETLAARTGVDNRVELVPFVADLAGELAKGSIAAMTSRAEGLGLAGMEAMAAGLPLVAYDCPVGPRYLVDDGVNGCLVRNGDIGAFARALGELMDDEDRRCAWGAAAVASVASFDEDLINDQWERLFADLIRSRRSTRRSAVQAPISEPAVSSSGADVQAIVRPRRRLGMTELRGEVREAVSAALAEAGVPSLPIAHVSSSRTSFAISRDEASRALVSLARSKSPLAIQPLRGHDVAGRPVEISSAADITPSATVLRVFLPATDPGGLVQRGSEISCDLEIWEHTLDGTTLSPPRPNRIVDRIPRQWLDSSGSKPTGPASGSSRNLWDEPAFEVDVVYTWVDGSDPEWLRRREHRRTGGQWHPAATAEHRYLNRDELKYSLRSILDNLPWVRRIHIVTDDQRPAWLTTTDDRLRLVSHRDIFPDHSALPTFNSHAIEASLHNIDGLAEHFLYINDDVLVTRPLPKQTFFEANGSIRVFFSPVKINYGTDAEPHIAAARNNRDLLRTRFGVEITNGLMHVPHPLTRSLLDEIEQEFPDAVRRTRLEPFRAPTDISPLSSFAQHYALITRRAQAGHLRYRYVGLGGQRMIKTMDSAARTAKATDVIALGESPEPVFDSRTIARAAHSFLNRVAPIPSRYEADE